MSRIDGATITGRGVLRSAIATRGRDVLAAAGALCGYQICEVLISILIGLVIDEAVGDQSRRLLLLWVTVLAADYLLMGVFFRAGIRHAGQGEIRAEQWARLRVGDAVLHPGGGATAHKLPGTLASIAVSDARRVGVLNAALPRAVSAVIGLLVAGSWLVATSLPLGLLIAVGAPALLACVHLLSRPLERRSAIEQEQRARSAGISADLLHGLRVLKGIGAEQTAERRYVEASRDALSATLSAARAQARYMGTVLALNGIFIAAVAATGGLLAAAGVISVGELVASVSLAQFVLSPMLTLGWFSGRLAQARASAARLAEVLNAQPAVSDGAETAGPGGAGVLRIDGLRCGHTTSLRIDVPGGQIVGVVLPEPGASAELVRILAGERHPERGTISVDGVDLTTLSLASARGVVLVAAHDAHLFAGTLRDNVLAGRTLANHLPLIRAARADQVGESMPNGLETEIIDQGRSLSGGQRQRIALARALVVAQADGAAVLVLHDPTTAVDAVTESEIAAGLREGAAGTTTLVVTTSPALLAATDRVVFVDNGEQHEGRHETLLRTAPAYRATVLS